MHVDEHCHSEMLVNNCLQETTKNNSPKPETNFDEIWRWYVSYVYEHCRGEIFVNNFVYNNNKKTNSKNHKTTSYEI